MTEPTESRPLKRTLPPDLQTQVEDIQIKVPRTRGPLDDLDEKQKRWLIVGICLHSIISPVLRTYVVHVVTKLCYSLTSRENIHKQTYGNYLERYAPNNTKLNYEAINNNKSLYGQNRARYDYRVKSPVDLSRLFLQTHMAHFTAFDDSCDSSALLGIIVNIAKFPPVVQADANKIRSYIRNPWAHCDFTDWTATKYSVSFQLMGQLISNLRLSNKEEHRILGELNKWATNGKKILSGTLLGLEILDEIRQQTDVLSKCVVTASSVTDTNLTELKDLAISLLERISNLESITTKHELQLKCVEAEIESNVPKNVRAQHEQYIREWEQDQTTFLGTRATYHIIGSLPYNNYILVTGSSGCGKSSIIHHVALHLRDNFEYEIIPVLTGPADIINYYNESKRQVFVVDDIYGKETINTQTFNTWRDNFEKMKKIFKTAKKVLNTNEGTVLKVSSPKLLMSCRLHIYKESQFPCVSSFTEIVFNLLSPELCLLQEERMLMLRKYLPDDTFCKLNEKQFIENIDFFPLVCKMAKVTKHEDVQKLFEAPLDIIKLNLKNIIHANKYQLCALTLCILFDEGFNTEWLKLRAAPEEKKYKIKDIVDEFDIKLNKELHRESLKSGFSTLAGTYLKLKGTEYRIIHDKIFKLAAVICGQKLTECFIKYTSSVLIRDRFIFESIVDVHGNDDSIVLLTDQEEDYFERLLCDLQHGDITSTFNNNKLIYQSFMNKLIRFFRKSDDAKSVLKNLETNKCILEKKHLPISFKTTPLIESASRGYFEIVQFMIGNSICNVNITDSRGRSPLHKASQKGHSDIVKLLLENKADISQCDKCGRSTLYLACEGGCKKTVELLLQYNADVSQCDEFARSPLHVSCNGGHTDIVKMLLMKNADVSQFDTFEQSPLYLACEVGWTETVELLLQYNIDVSQCDEFARSPLHVSCNEGHTDIVKLLLKKNADIYQLDKWKTSPLYMACSGGHKDTVEFLLQYKADVLQCDGDYNSSLNVSCQRGDIEIVKLLLQMNPDVSRWGLCEDPPLYVACDNGHKEIVELLLNYNADVCQSDFDGCSPLFVTVIKNHTDIIKLLLHNKADPSECNRDGVSPLFVACKNNCIDIVKLLLEKNADTSQLTNDGESPLFVACEYNCIDTVKLLLQYNADPSLCNNEGKYPLYMACKNKSIEIVKLLLQYNADPSLCNNKGKSPLYVACKKESIEIVRLLLENNPDVPQSINDQNERIIDTKIEILYSRQTRVLSTACQQKNPDIAKLLVQHKTDISRCNKNEESPLFVACQKCNIDIVKLLLQYDADVSHCNNDGESPLYIACEGGYTDLVKLLLKNKADPSRCNNNGISPLFVACQKENIDIVNLLLQYDVDVSHCNNDGESPLYIACERGYTDLVKVLLQNKADISQCNTNSQSSLYIACKECHKKIVSILLENNADISQCEKIDGWSPLHVVCDIDLSDVFQFFHKNSRIEIVKLLLAWNADVSLCDKNGQTPLDIARKSQCKEIVHLLEKNLHC